MTNEESTEQGQERPRLPRILSERQPVAASTLLDRLSTWPWRDQDGHVGRHRRVEGDATQESVEWTRTMMSADTDTLEPYRRLPVEPVHHAPDRPHRILTALVRALSWRPWFPAVTT